MYRLDLRRVCVPNSKKKAAPDRETRPEPPFIEPSPETAKISIRGPSARRMGDQLAKGAWCGFVAFEGLLPEECGLKQARSEEGAGTARARSEVGAGTARLSLPEP